MPTDSIANQIIYALSAFELNTLVHLMLRSYMCCHVMIE